jgi:ribosome-associated translation inhibitor RaiA
MPQTQITGIDLLDEKEKQLAEKLISDYYLKIKQLVRNDLSFGVHIKEYNTEGQKKKYAITIKASFAGKNLESNADDWDFARTIHKAMKKLENEIEKRIHSSEQHGSLKLRKI